MTWFGILSPGADGAEAPGGRHTSDEGVSVPPKVPIMHRHNHDTAGRQSRREVNEFPVVILDTELVKNTLANAALGFLPLLP